MDICGVIEGFYGRPWTVGQRLEETSRTASHLFPKLTELQKRDLLYAVYGLRLGD